MRESDIFETLYSITITVMPLKNEIRLRYDNNPFIVVILNLYEKN